MRIQTMRPSLLTIRYSITVVALLGQRSSSAIARRGPPDASDAPPADRPHSSCVKPSNRRDAGQRTCSAAHDVGDRAIHARDEMAQPPPGELAFGRGARGRPRRHWRQILRMVSAAVNPRRLRCDPENAERCVRS
jgi:hypothetical protein